MISGVPLAKKEHRNMAPKAPGNSENVCSNHRNVVFLASQAPGILLEPLGTDAHSGGWGGAGTVPPAPCRRGKAEEIHSIAAPQAPQGALRRAALRRAAQRSAAQ
eukprot:gene9907-biopygen6232